MIVGGYAGGAGGGRWWGLADHRSAVAAFEILCVPGLIRTTGGEGPAGSWRRFDGRRPGRLRRRVLDTSCSRPVANLTVCSYRTPVAEGGPACAPFAARSGGMAPGGRPLSVGSALDTIYFRVE